MQKGPKLSVIIPVFNTEKYVSKCLDSVLAQSHANLEAIIVDDGSAGNIKQIAREYSERDGRVRLVSLEKNSGLFRARIEGLASASGDFFAFADADDWLGVDFYRVLLKKALETDSDIVAGDCRQAYSDGTLVAQRGVFEQRDWDLRGKDIIHFLLTYAKDSDFFIWTVWNKIYSMELWRKSKEFLLSQKDHIVMLEDCAFASVFYSAATHLTNVHHNYYYYFRNNDSSTLAKKTPKGCDKNIGDIIKAFGIIKELLVQNGDFAKEEKNWRDWKNSILQSWEAQLLQDKTLPPPSRKTLLKKVRSNIAEPESDEFRLNRFYCSAAAPANDGYETIKRTIAAPDVEVVSFDCFDTLIQRPFFFPTDLFDLMDCKLNQFVGTTDFFNFKELRIRAEQAARLKRAIRPLGREEITFDEIYAQIRSLAPALSDRLERIKALEMSLELEYCSARKSGKELFEFARAMKKRVVVTSDMYLPQNAVREILLKNGMEPDALYLSSAVGKTKASGNLFKHLAAKEKTKRVVHIGDDKKSDVLNAQRAGFKAFQLEKASSLFAGRSEHSAAGKWFRRVFFRQQGYVSGSQAFAFWGLRCMAAVAANKMFDNPFCARVPESDFNADPYEIGFSVLGSHLYATADWLYHSAQENKFRAVNFIARDGYLPKKAFDILNKTLNGKKKSNYVWLSRRIILPLIIQSEADFYSLHNVMALNAVSPKKFISFTKAIIKDGSEKTAERICNKNKIEYDVPFYTMERLLRFGKIFFAEFYSPQEAAAFKERLASALDKIFKGKTATFDVGYSGRIESVLKRVYGYDITAHYIHINIERSLGRALKSGIKIKTLYKQSPFVTGAPREIFISEFGRSCALWQIENGSFTPVLREDDEGSQALYVVHTIQEAALDFVKSMARIFGSDLRFLQYRYSDASLPFEYLLHNIKPADLELFSNICFDDDFGFKKKKGLKEFWTDFRTARGSRPDAEDGDYEGFVMPELTGILYRKFNEMFPEGSVARDIIKSIVRFLIVKKDALLK